VVGVGVAVVVGVVVGVAVAVVVGVGLKTQRGNCVVPINALGQK